MAKLFELLVIGLSQRERQALNSIFSLTASRDCRYKVLPPNDISKGDIILVDWDDKESRDLSKQLVKEESNTPILWISHTLTENTEKGVYVVHRPLTIHKLLKSLDNLVMHHQSYSNTLTISDDSVVIKNAATKNIKSTHCIDKSCFALVVDDNATVRTMMQLELKSFDFEVDLVESAEEAQNKLQQGNEYRLIFLDINLPGMNGYQLCNIIRQNPNYRKTPLIMLTGRDSQLDKIRGSMSGANVYLTKPVEREKLQQVIQKYLPDKGTITPQATLSTG